MVLPRPSDAALCFVAPLAAAEPQMLVFSHHMGYTLQFAGTLLPRMSHMRISTKLAKGFLPSQVLYLSRCVMQR